MPSRWHCRDGGAPTVAKQHAGNISGRPTINALRVGFAVTAILTLALGYVGFATFLRHSAVCADRRIDLIYYDLQLFVLGADPLQGGGPYPIALEIARFAAPAVTMYAIFEIVLRLFAAEARRMRVRLARGHVIVCGEGVIAETLTRRLRATGQYVISVRSQAKPPSPSVGRWLTILGDPRDPEILTCAGIRHASALYICDADESTANTAIAFAASVARSSTNNDLIVHVHIRDPDLCLTLQARYLGLDHLDGLLLNFFNIDDVAARMLFADERLQRVNGSPPQIAVVGATTFSRTVIVEAARSWKADNPTTLDPLPVTVIDEQASLMVTNLLDRYPFLRTVCQLTPHDADLATVLVNGGLRVLPDRAFICYDDEDHALKTATAAERFWRSAPQSIIVRLDQVAAFQDETARGDHYLFNDADGRVRAFGVVSTACQPNIIGDDLTGRVAKAIHERYRQTRLEEGCPAEGNPSMAPWEELPDHLRESNRTQARDIGRKLSEIRCVIMPRVGQDIDGVLSDTEIEQLAEMEHGRWYDDYKTKGWEYDDRTDSASKTHLALRPWPELPDWLRQRNHETVRNLPAILSDAGFQIVHR